jgi:hypothetical protein
MARATALYEEDRRLREENPNMPEDERQRRFAQINRVSDLDQMTRQANALRESFYQMGSVASNALEQIILRGGNATQVLSAMLSQFASILMRRGMNMLMESGMDYIGGSLFGKGGGGGGGGVLGFIGSMLGLGSYGGGGGGSYGYGSMLMGETGGVGHMYAQGGVIGNYGPIKHMAQGDLVDRMRLMPMASGGTAMLGEAGPEAVFPLTRLPSGKLGISGAGGGAVNQFNVEVKVDGGAGGKDAKEQEDMGKRIGIEINRQLEAMVSKVLRDQQRPGGQLMNNGAPVYSR